MAKSATYLTVGEDFPEKYSGTPSAPQLSVVANSR
jgi:hypothetical protein